VVPKLLNALKKSQRKRVHELKILLYATLSYPDKIHPQCKKTRFGVKYGWLCIVSKAEPNEYWLGA